jgi:YVTN family beta-propeller protein
VAITPDGTTAYVADLDFGSVSTIDVATRFAPEDDILVGGGPSGVAFTPCAPAPPAPPTPSPVVIAPTFTG